MQYQCSSCDRLQRHSGRHLIMLETKKINSILLDLKIPLVWDLLFQSSTGLSVHTQQWFLSAVMGVVHVNNYTVGCREDKNHFQGNGEVACANAHRIVLARKKVQKCKMN